MKLYKVIGFIVLIFPHLLYADTNWTLKEIREEYLKELTQNGRRTPFRFDVDYVNDKGTSGGVRSSCWGSFQEMKNAFDNDVYLYQETFNDGRLRVNASYTAINFYPGAGTAKALAYFSNIISFDEDKWELYCTATTKQTEPEEFRPSEITYTILKLTASSTASPYIKAPPLIDLKTCLPNESIEAPIPITVGFIGYANENLKMTLTVKSNDLPNSFGIYVDNKNILNLSDYVISIPVGQKEKNIESYLKGNCPDMAEEYLWSAEYIYSIE